MKTLWLKFTILQVHFWLWVFGNNQFSLFVSLSLTDHVIMSWVIRWIFFLHVKTFEQILPYFLCFQFKDFALVFCWKKKMYEALKHIQYFPLFKHLFSWKCSKTNIQNLNFFTVKNGQKCEAIIIVLFCSTFCIVFFYIFTSFFLNLCIKEQF